MPRTPQTLETTLQAGQVIGGQFTVRAVHVGGFSEVAQVQDYNSTRRALKIIRQDRLSSSPDPTAVREQFHRECHVWQDMLQGCPYVARPLLSFLSYENLGPALFMEWVDGPSLSRLRPDGGRLSMSQTARLGRQIAEAMAYAHAKDILHRDLKPSNVLVTLGNEVRLIDWGLASVQEAVGFAGYPPGYASPQREQTPGLADKKDDVFSFAAILYQCLTGTLPDARAGRQAEALLLQAEPMLPDPLLRLILNGLSLDPNARPPFAQILATLADEDLCADLARREVERAFCPVCAFVSMTPLSRCPVCDSPCRQRIPKPVREGMVRITAGTFTQGLTREQAEQALLASGQPQPDPRQIEQIASELRRVFLPVFDIDVYPVTNAQFERFCRETNYPEPESFAAKKVAFPRHPVVDVTWKDALCYALWAGKRFPSPREWEKAARGEGDVRRYPWGETWSYERCNNSRNLSSTRTTEVTKFTRGELDGRSPFGVADMVGNVREWLSAGRHHELRGLRGGGWTSSCVIEGLVNVQVDAEVDFHEKDTGFRCAADIVYDEVAIAGTEEPRKGGRDAKG
jgi:formylglycine-generating enzyme required for sulfatase activity